MDTLSVVRYAHEWSHPDTALVIHTYPTIHIGLKSYYDRINAHLESLNHLLLEGVPVGRMRELGSYRRIARHLGLYAQTDALRIPKDLSVTNIDMDKRDFRRMLAAVPLRQRLALRMTMFFAIGATAIADARFKNALAAYFRYPTQTAYRLIDPKNHYVSTHREKSKLDLLITNDRDREISKKLIRYVRENWRRPYRFDIGIAFGDAHMPHMYQALAKLKFSWKLEDTFTAM